MSPVFRFVIALPLIWLVACGATPEPSVAVAVHDEHDHDEYEHGDDHFQLRLSAAQIRAAGIDTAPVTISTGGTLTVPAIIVADPTRSASVTATVAGRVQRVLVGVGMPVRAGAVLAVLDSREAAELGAELEAAQQQAQLMRANLEREERLFAEQVSPKVDVLTARNAAAEADIRLHLARQRIDSSGAAADGSRLLSIRAPIDGHIIARNAQAGVGVDAGSELFQIAGLSHLALELSLPPERAADVEIGSRCDFGLSVAGD